MKQRGLSLEELKASRVQQIVKATFSNASPSEKAQLETKFMTWSPGRLTKLSDLIGRNRQNEARDVILRWL
jgi:hypothetical protein